MNCEKRDLNWQNGTQHQTTLAKSGWTLPAFAAEFQYDVEVVGKSAIQTKSNSEIITTKEEYVVVKGDTLYSLSKKFNISIDELKKKNNIKSDSLSVGQKISVK